MLKRGIQDASSWNWKPWADGSKRPHNGSATSKPRSAPASASQRAVWALRSEPVASTTIPATIGTQTTRLRRGKPNSMSCCS